MVCRHFLFAFFWKNRRPFCFALLCFDTARAFHREGAEIDSLASVQVVEEKERERERERERESKCFKEREGCSETESGKKKKKKTCSAPPEKFHSQKKTLQAKKKTSNAVE
jgi:hypothetical protein